MRVLWFFICLFFITLETQAQDCGLLEPFSNGDIADADLMAGNLKHLSCRIDKVKPDRVIWVDQLGGDFTTINAAMGAIGTDLAEATSDAPVLIRLGPGRHEIDSTLTVKDHVYVQGSGREVTEVVCAPEKTCGYLFQANNVRTRISDMTISAARYAVRSFQNTFGNDCHVEITNVSINLVATGTFPPTGVDAIRCNSIYLRDVQISADAYGASSFWGVYTSGNGTVKTENLSIYGGGASAQNVGVYAAANGFDNHIGLDINVTGGGQNGNAFAYYLLGTGGATPPSRIRDSSLTAVGGGRNLGAYVGAATPSSMQVLNSVIYAGNTPNNNRAAMYCEIPLEGSSPQVMVGHSTVNSTFDTNQDNGNAFCFRCAFVWNYLSDAGIAGEELDFSCATGN